MSVQQVPDRAVGTIHDEKQDTRANRWQYQRQEHQDIGQGLPGKSIARQQVGERHTEQGTIMVDAVAVVREVMTAS